MASERPALQQKLSLDNKYCHLYSNGELSENNVKKDRNRSSYVLSITMNYRVLSSQKLTCSFIESPGSPAALAAHKRRRPPTAGAN